MTHPSPNDRDGQPLLDISVAELSEKPWRLSPLQALGRSHDTRYLVNTSFIRRGPRTLPETSLYNYLTNYNRSMPLRFAKALLFHEVCVDQP